MNKLMNRLTDKRKFPRNLLWPQSVTFEIRNVEEWRRQHDESSVTIRKTLMVQVGYCFFCLLTLGAPDYSLLDIEAKVRIPFANVEVSYSDFLFVGPIVLIAITTYLHIFIGHWILLSGRDQEDTIPLPFIFNIKHPLASIVSRFLVYWLTPLTLIIFAWKASPRPDVLILYLMVFVIIKVMIFLSIRRYPVKLRYRVSYRLLWILFLSVLLIELMTVSGFLTIKRTLDLPGANLKNRNLVGFYFENAHMSEVNLNNAKLSTANLRKAILNKANLENAQLSKSNLINADLSNSILKNADLSFADLRNANLKGANLENANLMNAKLDNVNFKEAYLKRANLQSVEVRNVRFIGTNLTEANFKGASLQNVDLTDAIMNYAYFINSKLTNIIIDGTDLTFAFLYGADITINWEDSDRFGLSLFDKACMTANQVTETNKLNPNMSSQGEIIYDDMYQNDCLLKLNWPVIHFPSTAAKVSLLEENKLISLSNLMKDIPHLRVRLAGHTDERGTNEYSMELGKQYAISVKNYLIQLGINENRLCIMSYGEERPINADHNPDAWQQNRRVEIGPIFVNWGTSFRN